MKRKIVILVMGITAGAHAQTLDSNAILAACPASEDQPKCVFKQIFSNAVGSGLKATANLPSANNRTGSARGFSRLTGDVGPYEEPTPVSGPYQQQLDFKIYSGAQGVVGRLDIPAGMQLVIESVSAYATVPSGQVPRISISSAVRGATATRFLPLIKQDGEAGGTDWMLGNATARFYADGPGISISIVRAGAMGNATFSLVVSGTLSAAQ